MESHAQDEVRHVALPNGAGILEVTMTPEFIRRLRKQFMLNDDQPVQDDHVRMFIWGALENALRKVENP